MTTDKKLHPFDQATTLTLSNNLYHGKTSTGYTNMVGPFGGIIAAVLLKSVFENPERIGEPLSFTVNYAAPIKNGGFHIKTKITRTNNSTQHWTIELFQEDMIAVTATAVFAIRRKTWSATDAKFPKEALTKKPVKLTADEMPPWMERYEMEFIKGSVPPFIPIEDEEPFVSSESIHWVKDSPSRPLDFLSLAAICDSFFLRIHVRRKGLVPSGTVSMTTYFHADSETISAVGEEKLLGSSRANRFYNNYFDQTSEIWTKKGNLLASSTQVGYFKE